METKILWIPKVYYPVESLTKAFCGVNFLHENTDITKEKISLTSLRSEGGGILVSVGG
jgi:hypothetical protein